MIVRYGYQEGDVAMVCATGVLGPLAIYRHAALIWWRNGTWYTVEAGLRVTVWKGSHWGTRFDVYRPDGAIPEQGQIAADAALSRVGEFYGFLHLIPVAWRMIRRRTLGVQQVICTELVRDAWMKAGITLCPDNPWPTPDELAKALA